MSLLHTAAVVAVGFVVVTLARVVVVYGTTGRLGRTSERLQPGWGPLVAWGGLRGALAMVLALALPVGFPQRTLLIDMTFGVVVASLLVQGLTIPLLAARLLGAREHMVSAAPDGDECRD
jgi:CPA1 family monovalent cation:H+ antiporter